MNSFVFLWMLTAQLASDDKLPIDEVKGAEGASAIKCWWLPRNPLAC